MPHNSPTPAQVDAWNNPASLGFSTWQRHATTGAVARIPLIQKKQMVHQRNASFIEGLISRRLDRTGFDSGNTNFVFRLNRHAASKYVNDDVWNASNNLKPIGHGTSDEIVPNKAGQNHGANMPRLQAMPDGADRNNSLMRRGITMSGGYSSPSSIIPDTAIARGSPLNFNRSFDADKPATYNHDGLNLWRAVVPKKDGASSPAIKPSENIARSATPSEAKIPGNPSPAETNAYSGGNMNVMHESDHTRSLPVRAAESVFSNPVFFSGNSLPRSLVQRSPLSLNPYSSDLSTHQRLPLRINPMVITRKLQTSHAGSATVAPARSEWLPINHGTLYKTVSRQNLEDGRAEGGFALPENPGYAHMGGSATRPTPGNIARSSQTEIRRIGKFSPVLNQPTTFSPVISAIPEAVTPYADLITHDFQDSMKAADTRSVLPIKLAVQRGPISKSALPQRSTDSFHRTPLQRHIRNELPTYHTHALQRSSRITAPDIPASPFRAHRYDSLLALRKTIAQRTSSIASTPYLTSAPDAIGTASQVDQPLARTDIGHTPFFDTTPHLIVGVTGAQPGMQRSQGSPSSAMALHTQLSSRLSRLASPSSPPDAFAGASYLSLKQGHRFNKPLGSRPAGTQSAHILPGLSIPPAITSTTSRINRFIRYADRSLGFTAPLAINGLEVLGAGYSSVPGVTTNPRFSSAPDATGTDTAATATAPNAANASGFDPASHIIKRFTQNAAGALPMLRPLEKNLNPRFLPLSRASAGRTAPLAITRQPMAASNASASSTVDANLAGSQQGARAIQRNSGTLSKSMPGAAERPLAIVQRTPAQLMRMPGEGNSDERYHDLPADRHGVVPAPYQVSRQVSDTPPGKAGMSGAAVSPSGEPDTDAIAEHAWRSMMKRLIIEQERRGLAKWP
jgi:hypothetical protein